MENTLGVIDVIGLVLAVIATCISVRLVLRTEGKLDTAAKFLLANSVILVIANLISINDYFGGIVPNETSRIIFHFSRIAALLVYISAIHILVKIAENRKCD